MGIAFVTSNAHKLAELRAHIPGLEQLEMDIPEIQSEDPEDIVRAKLETAAAVHKGEIIVEDTSLFLDCMDGFPGPFIKWFLAALGREGLAALAAKEPGAEARTVIGWTDGEETRFFTGSLRGTIVAPRGDSAFGWDPIFVPQGNARTFAEMTQEEKSTDSHRTRAVREFLRFHESRHLRP